MREIEEFYNEQYRGMARDESNAVDIWWYTYLLPFAKTRDEVVRDLIGMSSFSNVLDLGCGKCGLAERLIDRFEHYLGVDVSSIQLASVSAGFKSNPKVTLEKLDLSGRLPFPNGGFDLVLCVSVLQYVFDPYLFLNEIHRVLNSGGFLILNTVNLAFFVRRLQLLFGRLPTYNHAPGWRGGIIRDFTVPALYTLVRKSGFEIMSVKTAGLFSPLRMWWPNLLASDVTLLCRKANRSLHDEIK